MKRYIVVLVGVVFLSASVLSRGQESAANTETGQGKTEHPVTEVVRALATQGQVVPLPAKGKMKHSIKKDGQAYALSSGMSPVVLFKLPDYVVPYTLTIVSPCNHGCLGFSKSIFVPSAVFLDAAFKPTKELANTEFQIMHSGFSKPFRLETTVFMDEARKGEAYLLLFTLADDVGRVVERSRIRTSTGAPVLFGKKTVDVKGSADGTLELEVRAASSRDEARVPPREPRAQERRPYEKR